MSDNATLVERLRFRSRHVRGVLRDIGEKDGADPLCDEAAARIAELEAALRPFAEADDPNRLSDADLDVVARVLFEYRYYRRARDAIRARPAP